MLSLHEKLWIKVPSQLVAVCFIFELSKDMLFRFQTKQFQVYGFFFGLYDDKKEMLRILDGIGNCRYDLWEEIFTKLQLRLLLENTNVHNKDDQDENTPGKFFSKKSFKVV